MYRYSLGSIALWSVADSVETINPYVARNYVTRKHFSYFKFYIGDNVQRLVVSLSNCTVLSGQPHSGDRDQCIEYASLRDRALPRHTPEHGGVTDISVNMSATFTEERPYKDSYYYLLVVSSNTVSFHFSMDYKECGKAGLYGREQKDWMMTESGLKYNISQSEAKSSDTERQHSFQLFSVDVKLPEEMEKNFDLPDTERLTEEKERQSKDQVSCRSTFDFTRIDLAEEFSTNFILQSRSFYTKWLTVFNRFPIITRFKTLDHSDLGGTVNIILGMEEIENTHGQTVEIYGCLERGREPVVRNNTMECSEDSQIKVILV